VTNGGDEDGTLHGHGANQVASGADLDGIAQGHVVN